ncbi:OFA family MFS transporter [Deltaproteobacteria bacterium OttesenSCG-928-M10]|nr:OFA family MFS transporter [Deltaproteobacteria bacterium OttesenSCG-928-M10]
MNNSVNRWTVLIASSLINLCIGSVYAWSVFAAPMAAQLGLNTADLAVIFTIASGVGPITMIWGGKITEKIGVRQVVLLGGIMYGLGFILSGFSGSLGALMVSYGLVSGLGLGMVYGCTINNTIKFFPDKRGLIGGILTAVYGLSSVIIPPVANKMIVALGILPTFRILGLVFLLVICGAAMLVRQPPHDYRPANWMPSPAQASRSGQDKDWRAMLKDPVFYIMISLLMCGAFYGLMLISQASPIAQNLIGVDPATAAICVSVLALFNMGGRVIAGYLSDLFGRVNTLITMLILAMVGFVLILNCSAGDLILFMAAMSVIGASFGAFMGIFPGFTADQFGPRHVSINYGIMFIGFAVAGVLGPIILSSIYKTSGSYQTAFLACIGLSVLGLILALVYKARSKSAQAALKAAGQTA